MKKMHTAICFVLLFALVLYPACFAKFNATRQIYKFNSEVGSKWAQWGVFLGFIIIPVYGVAILLDELIFNTIEFWGGKNPINDPYNPTPPMEEPTPEPTPE